MGRKPLTLVAAMTLGWANMTLPADAPVPSKEARQKMAAAHDKMAACLRSDRDFAECRTEMMQTCKDTMGKQGCGMGMGMMGEHGQGHGHGQGQGQGKMSPPTSTKSP